MNETRNIYLKNCVLYFPIFGWQKNSQRIDKNFSKLSFYIFIIFFFCFRFFLASFLSFYSSCLAVLWLKEQETSMFNFFLLFSSASICWNCFECKKQGDEEDGGTGRKGEGFVSIKILVMLVKRWNTTDKWTLIRWRISVKFSSFFLSFFLLSSSSISQSFVWVFCEMLLHFFIHHLGFIIFSIYFYYIFFLC